MTAGDGQAAGFAEPSASRSLDKIREGAQTLLLNVRQRLPELEDALDKGQLTAAHRLVTEISQSTAVLASAEMNIATMADAAVVRATDLEVGMALKNLGVITNVEREDVGAGEAAHLHVHLAFENGAQTTLVGEHEVVIDTLHSR